MLKNNNQRKEYLHNKDNWEIVGTLSYDQNQIIRLKRLKNTDICKIEVHILKSEYLKERWGDPGYYPMFVIENGLYKHAINNTEAINIIKETKENSLNE